VAEHVCLRFLGCYYHPLPQQPQLQQPPCGLADEVRGDVPLRPCPLAPPASPAGGLSLHGLAQQLPEPVRSWGSETFASIKKVHQFETQELAYLLVCSEADEERRALIYTDTHTHRPNDGSHCSPSAAAP
jgi:hypothetical protein